jgi:hypothetical protein
MSDDDSFEEELARRNLLAAWDKLAAKHIYPKGDSTKGLAVELRLMTMLLSPDPRFRRDIPKDKLPKVLAIVKLHRARVFLAQIALDLGFLHRLWEAGKLVVESKGRDVESWMIESLGLNKLTLAGYGLVAWAYLYGELGHRPSEQQVRERVEQFRKEDGQTGRISDRQWARMFTEMRPLFRRT